MRGTIRAELVGINQRNIKKIGEDQYHLTYPVGFMGDVGYRPGDRLIFNTGDSRTAIKVIISDATGMDFEILPE